MGRFVLRPAASSDLDGIWDYSAEHWGVERANRYVGDIRSAIQRIADDPHIGRPCNDRLNHFKVLAGSHVVLYRVVEGGVAIIRILHQRMDLARHF